MRLPATLAASSRSVLSSMSVPIAEAVRLRAGRNTSAVVLSRQLFLLPMNLLEPQSFPTSAPGLKTLAFTGTKGKTTAAYFAKNILDIHNHNKTAMFSTMDTTLDGKNFFKSQLTTPESIDLFRMMREAVRNGMTHLVMEVSSQAYKTARVYGLTFDVGVFLNISPDHIGPIEHPTFEDYFYCKRQLLANSRFAVVNAEKIGRAHV